MAIEDRDFWITDIGGRFKDMYFYDCKAGTSGDKFMAMIKERLVNEQGMDPALELFLFNDVDGNACDKCEDEEMFQSFWKKGKPNQSNFVRLWITRIIPTIVEWGFGCDTASVSGVSYMTEVISPVKKKLASKRVQVRRSPRLNKQDNNHVKKPNMRPTRLDFVHEEQGVPTQASVADNQEHGYGDIPTQASIADNQEQGFEDDQVNFPNVHTDECHPDDKPEFLFKEHADEEAEEGEDESEDEETQEKFIYEDWVSLCSRGIDVGNEHDDCNEDF
ncbi:hypothetical protein MKX03_012071, partial [Papaver bracteatum]